MKRIIILFLSILLVLSCFTGCTWADDLAKFNIEVFEDFEKKETHADCQEYILEGNMDFAKINGVVVYPWIRDEHNDSLLVIRIYSESEDACVRVKKAVISQKYGTVIFQANSPELTFDNKPYGEKLMSSADSVGRFDHTDEWYYDGSVLNLLLEMTVSDGENETETTVSYDVVVKIRKMLMLPTA